MSMNKQGAARYGVHSIDHFSLEVPDVEQARHFMTNFGLALKDHSGALEASCFGHEHCWVKVFPGSSKRLAYLSFNCYADEFEALKAQILQQGATAATQNKYVTDEGFWFFDLDANLLQLKVGPKTTSYSKSPLVSVSTPAGERGVLGRKSCATVQPNRLSHVLMFTTDMNKALSFYAQALGLYLSDRSGNAVAFMHGRHGSDHHLVAFVEDEAKGWHHSAWDVPSVDAVGQGSEQMRNAGYVEGWGLGRHTLGSNYFHYVRDPWGSFWEYSAHIDYVPAGQNWPSGDYPAEDALYLWGPELPKYFIFNTER